MPINLDKHPDNERRHVTWETEGGAKINRNFTRSDARARLTVIPSSMKAQTEAIIAAFPDLAPEPTPASTPKLSTLPTPLLEASMTMLQVWQHGHAIEPGSPAARAFINALGDAFLSNK